jgi:hypothetical protein
MLDALTRLGRSALSWLDARPDITAILVPGAIGGFTIWLMAPPDAQFLESERPIVSFLLSLIFGAFSGIILVAVITNTDRRDTLRLAGMAFLAGLAWPAVVNQALNSIGASLFTEVREDVQEVAAFARQTGKGSNEEDVESLIREVRDLFSELPRNEQLRATVEDVLAYSISDLRNSQRQQVAEIVNGLDSPGLQQSLASRDWWLEDFPTIIGSVSGEFIDIDSLSNNTTTDDEGSVLFGVETPALYDVCTPDTEDDLVAIIYDADSGERVASDDDSGVGLTPAISARLEAGQYVLRVYDYNSLAGVANVRVSFSNCPSGR